MNTQKIILGGGISGLIYAVLHPHYILITQDIGGLARRKCFAPFMIHFSTKTMQFLQMMNCPFIVKRCKVGFYFEGQIHNYLPKDLAEAYYIKSRGEAPDFEMEAVAPGEKDFYYFSIHLNNFINQLHLLINSSQDRIYRKQIVKIDLKQQLIGVEKDYFFSYEELVSTLPAPVFFKLAKRKQKFESVGKVFHTNRLTLHDKIDMENYNYVYFPSPKDALLRATQIFDGYSTYQVWEYSSLLDSVEQEGAELIVEHAYILRPAQAPLIKGIQFVGRFAEWKDYLLIHDIIDRYME